MGANFCGCNHILVQLYAGFNPNWVQLCEGAFIYVNSIGWVQSYVSTIIVGSIGSIALTCWSNFIWVQLLWMQ